MKSRASSFPVERPARRWYREPWPWLLMAGPFAVVVASLASAWIAAATDDGVVAHDYYKQGLLINRKLKPVSPPAARDPGATISLSKGGELHVRLQGIAAPPARLHLSLARPGGDVRVVELVATANGDWTGSLPDLGSERRIVTLESEAWRLPVTTVAGRFIEIRLGAAARKS